MLWTKTQTGFVFVLKVKNQKNITYNLLNLQKVRILISMVHYKNWLHCMFSKQHLQDMVFFGSELVLGTYYMFSCINLLIIK